MLVRQQLIAAFLVMRLMLRIILDHSKVRTWLFMLGKEIKAVVILIDCPDCWIGTLSLRIKHAHDFGNQEGSLLVS